MLILMKFAQYYWKQLVAKILLFLLFFVGCTNSPSGAIEYNTTVYYIDGKFHEEIPEEYIFKTWGYRITDALGTEHTYKNKVEIPPLGFVDDVLKCGMDSVMDMAYIDSSFQLNKLKWNKDKCHKIHSGPVNKFSLRSF